MKINAIPFHGCGDFRLYQSTEEAKKIIRKNGFNYSVEVWSNKECTKPVPWTIINIENKIHLFFAKNKLFRIYLCNECEARLPNGIAMGMGLDEALEIDSNLKYDDWHEDYQSPQGYWLEDDLDDRKVMSISIFIKEALDEERFEKYNW